MSGHQGLLLGHVAGIPRDHLMRCHRPEELAIRPAASASLPQPTAPVRGIGRMSASDTPSYAGIP
jgi:hypothetical protein